MVKTSFTKRTSSCYIWTLHPITRRSLAASFWRWIVTWFDSRRWEKNAWSARIMFAICSKILSRQCTGKALLRCKRSVKSSESQRSIRIRSIRWNKMMVLCKCCRFRLVGQMSIKMYSKGRLRVWTFFVFFCVWSKFVLT